jgi:hypothetical protein
MTLWKLIARIDFHIAGGALNRPAQHLIPAQERLHEPAHRLR